MSEAARQSEIADAERSSSAASAYFDADGSPFVFEGGVAEDNAAPASFPPVPGWYPSPAGDPYPWYFDGTEWVHPAERFDTLLENLVDVERMTSELYRTCESRIKRRYRYAQIKAFLKGSK